MTLDAFLHPVEMEQVKEVMISKRFLNSEGNPEPFKIRVISEETNETLSKLATRTEKINGRKIEVVDGIDYTRRLIVACTVYPDFSASDICQRYGVLDPLMVPSRMLSGGEYKRLVQEIMKFNEFDNPEELELEAKN